MVSNTQLRLLPSNNDDSLFGFSLTKNGLTMTFESPSESAINDWVSALKMVCVLQNFHDEYKAIKMIGKGSFAKV